MNLHIKTIILISFVIVCSLLFAQKTSYYKIKAKKGDASSQMFLGLCFEGGKGCEKNMDSAFYWYKRAAKSGLAEAQVLLGNCYREGKGCQKDSVQALQWYQTAAWCESSLGLDAMGDVYYYGIGTERDVIRARYYYNKAANKGNKKSKQKYTQIRYEKQDAIPKEF